MNLLVAEIRPHRAVCKHIRHVEQRTSVVAGFLAFPSKISSAIAVLRRFSPCAIERMYPVHDEIARDVRLAVQEKWQHEHFGVPEHRSLIHLAGQATRWNRYLLRMRRRNDMQPVEAIAQCELRFAVAVDLNVRRCPLAFPLPFMIT
ncbi:hypothetical protein D3C84_943990 [compost metagenome]